MNNPKWYKSLLEKLSRRARTPLFVFLGGAILGVGLLLFIMSGNLTLPMITISPSTAVGETSSFFTLEDGGIRIGENTIRVSRHRLDMGNKRITNLAAPVAGTDAATRGFVEAQPSGAVRFWEIRQTTTTHSGNLGGYAGANSICASAFGAGWVMLNASHLGSAVLGGAILVPSMNLAPQDGWIGAGRGGVRWLTNSTAWQPLFIHEAPGSWWGSDMHGGLVGTSQSDCRGWSSIHAHTGSILTAMGSVRTQSCLNSLPLWCALPR